MLCDRELDSPRCTFLSVTPMVQRNGTLKGGSLPDGERKRPYAAGAHVWKHGLLPGDSGQTIGGGNAMTIQVDHALACVPFASVRCRL